MIIQSINVGPSAPPIRHVSNDAPVVASDIAKSEVIQQLSSSQLKSAVENINRTMQQSAQSLEFSIDPGTKTPVVRMMDTETGKIIRQFPSEEVLAIAQSIDQFLSEHQLQQGLLLKQKA